MFKMLIPNKTVDKNIVKINNDEVIDVRSQHIIHKPHKDGRGIAKSKWHD
jgi:hypothetical protein